MSDSQIKPMVWFGGSFLIFLSAFIAFISPQPDFFDFDSTQSQLSDSSDASITSISWKTLRNYDYKTKTLPPDLEALVGKTVKIPGFAVPLSSNYKDITEVLFVPDQLACIHVPAPPPHLVVLAQLASGSHINQLIGPLWLQGRLELKESTSVYGGAAWQIRKATIEPYFPNKTP